MKIQQTDKTITRRQKERLKRGGWEPINHACRHCGGRLLQKQGGDKETIVRCIQCDATVTGKHEDLCCCGEEVTGYGAIWECFVNPDRSPTNPQVILVRERALPRVVQAKPKPYKPVLIPEF